jgi:hypothetical protein
MSGMTPLRLRLWAESAELTGFDAETALDSARTRLADLRGDVELTHVERLSPDSIGVVLLAAPTIAADALGGIVADLRAALEIGPGLYVPIPSDPGAVRGIGGQGRTCPDCGATDGSHLLGCPRSRR